MHTPQQPRAEASSTNTVAATFQMRLNFALPYTHESPREMAQGVESEVQRWSAMSYDQLVSDLRDLQASANTFVCQRPLPAI